MKTADDRSWKLYSLALMALYLFFQAMSWPLSPKFLDMYYHLAVVKGFHDAGGYVTQAFWEFAPGGRPHLYPPFLHMLMLFFYELGLPAIDVGRLVDLLSFPALLFAFWDLVRRTHSERLAFTALLILSGCYSVLIASVTLPAFNLAFILALMGLAALQGNKRFLPGLLLGLAFYTHTLMAFLMALMYALWAMGEKDARRRCVRALALGLLSAAPFLAYQFLSKEHFGFVKLKENLFLEFDLGVYACALSALWVLRSPTFKKMAFVPVILWISMTPLVATHPVRFLYGHGLVGAAWLAALVLDYFLGRGLDPIRRKRKEILYALSLVFFLLASPVLRLDRQNHTWRVDLFSRSLDQYLHSNAGGNFSAKGFSIYFPEPYEEIAKIVRDNSIRGDILWTDFSYTAGILSILSDRSTSCAMLAEVKPYEVKNRLTDAKVIVWFKDRDSKATAEMTEAAERYRFRLIKETEMAFIYINEAATAHSSVPRALIPLWALLGLSALFLGRIVVGTFRSILQ